MIVQFDLGVLPGLSRNEMFLFFQIALRANEDGIAWLTMKQLQKITSWHYQQILANTGFLVEKGLIENTPTDDKTGHKKVEYRIPANVISPLLNASYPVF